LHLRVPDLGVSSPELTTSGIPLGGQPVKTPTPGSSNFYSLKAHGVGVAFQFLFVIIFIIYFYIFHHGKLDMTGNLARWKQEARMHEVCGDTYLTDLPKR
jgi:hypothetical protein